MRSWVAILLSPGVLGWWHGGHHITGHIAYKTLIDQSREDVVEMIEKILSLDPDNYGNHSTFLTAPTWMDDIRPVTRQPGDNEVRDMFETWNNNHFMNIPLVNGCSVNVPDSCPTIENVREYLADATLNHINVPLRGAFNHHAPYNGAVKHPGNARLWALELDLKFIFHLLGDAHMPFHTSSMWHTGLWECPEPCHWHFCSQCEEKTEAEGGQPGKRYIFINQNCVGGNAIQVAYAGDVDPDKIPPSSNLHGFWDSLGGFAQARSNDVPDELKISLAEEVMAEWPLSKVMDSGFKTWNEHWTLEDDVYPEVYATAAQGTEWDGSLNGQPWYGFLGVDTNLHLCYDALLCSGASCRVNCDSFENEDECAAENSRYCQTYRHFLINEEYRQFAERASKRLIAIAGYRLADALRRIVDGLGARLRSDIAGRNIGACDDEITDNTTEADVGTTTEAYEATTTEAYEATTTGGDATTEDYPTTTDGTPTQPDGASRHIAVGSAVLTAGLLLLQ